MTSIINFLSPVEFRLTINRLPNLEFFIQNATVPGLSGSPLTIATPFKNVYFTPDKLEYEELTVTSKVDEQFQVFLEIYNWLEGISFPDNFNQYDTLNNSDEGLFSDATLTILNSSKNPNIELTFKNMFPVALSSIPLDITQSDVNPPTVDITFRYDSYTINVLT